MRIVVTGGLGFIGTSVVQKLTSMDHEVIVVDFIERLMRSYDAAELPILRQIYSNLNRCAEVIEPYDFLADPPMAQAYVHLGACVDTKGVPDDLFEKNVRYVRALVNSLRRESRIVYASSAAVYGTEGFPCNAYGVSKKLGENILKDDGSMHVTALRFFNVFGRHEHHKGEMASVPFKIAGSYRTRSRFEMFCPDASRDFISVDAVADAVVGHATQDPITVPTWEVYDVGMGKSLKFNDLDYSLRVVFNRPESVCEHVPMPGYLERRYQFYTRAGARNAKISPYIDQSVDIRDHLEEQFNAED